MTTKYYYYSIYPTFEVDVVSLLALEALELEDTVVMILGEDVL